MRDADGNDIYMDCPQDLMDMSLKKESWARVHRWIPVLRSAAAVTNHLQSDTTTLSAVHLTLPYLEKRVSVYSLPNNVKNIVAERVNGRYGNIFSPVRLLSFYLDLLTVPCREATNHPAPYSICLRTVHK
jgi:hypothetical protein